jgi:excisionase family DNA binding protein
MHADTTALTVKDAANRLKVSQRFVAKLIADRRLPSLKLGRRRLIREAALKAYLTQIETTAR